MVNISNSEPHSQQNIHPAACCASVIYLHTCVVVSLQMKCSESFIDLPLKDESKCPLKEGNC